MLGKKHQAQEIELQFPNQCYTTIKQGFLVSSPPLPCPNFQSLSSLPILFRYHSAMLETCVRESSPHQLHQTRPHEPNAFHIGLQAVLRLSVLKGLDLSSSSLLATEFTQFIYLKPLSASLCISFPTLFYLSLSLSLFLSHTHTITCLWYFTLLSLFQENSKRPYHLPFFPRTIRARSGLCPFYPQRPFTGLGTENTTTSEK